MTKLEQAARQALEALEELADAYRMDINSEFETHANPDPGGNATEYKQAVEAITALREALAEPTVKESLTTQEQAEQRIPSRVHIIKQMEIIPEQRPVAEVDDTAPGFINWTTWKLPEQGTKLYAAPVRTKDLTITEMNVAYDKAIKDTDCNDAHTEGLRAVIQEYRRKNGIV